MIIETLFYLILIALSFGAYLKLMQSIEDSRKPDCERRGYKQQQIHKYIKPQNIEAEIWHYQSGFDFSSDNDIKF